MSPVRPIWATLFLLLLVSPYLVESSEYLHVKFNSDYAEQVFPETIELNLTTEEVIHYYSALSRRWYDVSTFKLFTGVVIGHPHGYQPGGYMVLRNITFSVHEADVIGGVVYLYPPVGLSVYEVVGYENVYVMYLPTKHPQKLNIPWAVNFMYDFIGFIPSLYRGWYSIFEPTRLPEIHEDAYTFYRVLAPDYYVLEYEPRCVYEFPEKHHDYIFFDAHLDPLRFLCYAPPFLNITPRVFVKPELYEELRVQYGVYPIHIWINEKIRYVGILAGLETTIGGLIRPDALRLINKYTGLNLTNDYVVFVIVAPMFANKGPYSYTLGAYVNRHAICSARGCLYTGLGYYKMSVSMWEVLADIRYTLGNYFFEEFLRGVRNAYGSNFPVYFDIPLQNVELRPVYTYQPEVVVPEGVCHVKPTYDYLLFSDYLRDLRASNLTLPPPNTECIYTNGTWISEESPAESITITASLTTTQPPSDTTTETELSLTGDVITLTTSIQLPTDVVMTLTSPTIQSPTRTIDHFCEPCQTPYWLLIVGLAVGVVVGVSLTMFTRKRVS